MAYAFDPKDDVETQWQKWSAQLVQPSILTDEARGTANACGRIITDACVSDRAG